MAARDGEAVLCPDHVGVVIGVEDGRAVETAAFMFDQAADQFRQVEIITGNT